MSNKPFTFHTNLQSELVSYVTHDNREFLAAPCTAIVAGVLNRDLVPIEPIQMSCQSWNGRPLLLNHSYDGDGLPISANSPAIIESQGIGTIWNAHIDDDRLKVEIWVDTAKCENLGGDAVKVIDSIKNGTPVECSTGYFASMREKRGIYNDKEYDEITETIYPDHLALLPNSIGACNWSDGCGTPRLNQQEEGMDERTIRTVIMDSFRKLIPHLAFKDAASESIVANMTMMDKIQALNTLITAEMISEGVDSWRWHVVDIEDDFVIIGIDNMIKRRQFADTDGGNIIFTGEWEDVHRQTTFQPVANHKMCDACVAIHAQAEEDERTPESETDAQSGSTTESIPNHESIQRPDEDGDDNPTQEEEEMSEVTTQQADTLKTFLDELGVNQDDIKAALEVRSNRRKEWATAIKANTELSDDDLLSMPDKVLEQLAKTYAATTEEVANTSEKTEGVFIGRGMPASSSKTGTVEPLRRPQVLVNKRDQKAS